MNAPRLELIHAARLALRRPGTGTPAAGLSKELRLLQRRVEAARYGINAPQNFHAVTRHEHAPERWAPTLL